MRIVLLVAVMAVASWLAQHKTIEAYSTPITPLYVVAPEKSVDQRIITVVFPWRESGYCTSQFRITATESPTRVVVDQVMARTIGTDEICAGVGTDGVTAGDTLQPQAPLGDRIVTRAQGCKQLEVRQPAAGLGPTTPTGSRS
ncbi:hypothetical protein [Terrabacter sp. NPDC080008]|uniref:hypothetical protein n=1 Tax=Terrabacter sp. NPDC080008 TaxID=3155176 RepID=UPI00344D2239